MSYRRCRQMNTFEVQSNFFTAGSVITQLFSSPVLYWDSPSVFIRALRRFTTCQRPGESLLLAQRQKNHRKGHEAGDWQLVFAVQSASKPVHAGLTCYCEPPPWHEQALTAVRSVLLPDRRRWGFLRTVSFYMKHLLVLVSAEVWISDEMELQRERASRGAKCFQMHPEQRLLAVKVHYGK